MSEKKDRIMETSMSSSQGPRKIHPRRKPAESEKMYKCACGKSYLSGESLYTHRKTKHPEELIKQTQGPEREESNLQSLERDESVKKVIVNSETFSMLTKSAFLNFFREMKELSDQQAEILKLFHSEKRGFTKLNFEFLDQGTEKFLNYITQAYRLNENIPDPREISLMQSVHDPHWLKVNLITTSNNPTKPNGINSNSNHHTGGALSKENGFDLIMTKSGTLPLPMVDSYNIHNNLDFGFDNNKMTDSILKQEANLFDEIPEWKPLHQNEKQVVNTTQTEANHHKNNTKNNNTPIVKLEDIPEYYRDFFTIVKEMVKPMTEKFAMEICYLFDKLIELSSVQQNLKIHEYKSINQHELTKLITQNTAQFPKFNALQQINRDNLIEKLLFNLAHLFQTNDIAPIN